MSEFNLQFKPSMVKGGSVKVRTSGGKYYVSAFVQGRGIIHQSSVVHKTATGAILYSHQVIERYQRMAVSAFRQWMESVNGEAVKE